MGFLTAYYFILGGTLAGVVLKLMRPPYHAIQVAYIVILQTFAVPATNLFLVWRGWDVPEAQVIVGGLFAFVIDRVFGWVTGDALSTLENKASEFWAAWLGAKGAAIVNNPLPPDMEAQLDELDKRTGGVDDPESSI